MSSIRLRETPRTWLHVTKGEAFSLVVMYQDDLALVIAIGHNDTIVASGSALPTLRVGEASFPLTYDQVVQAAEALGIAVQEARA